MGNHSEQPARSITHDAVIVLPGIMGSELVEAATGRQVWGISDVRWYFSAWVTGQALRTLAVTDEERDGRTGRIKARGLLRTAPAFAPVLRGFEPYTSLMRSIARVVSDPAAVLEFAYDWRLSVQHNAILLERAADEHLARWRAHPRGSAGARLVFVAHSMGGLIARCLATKLDRTQLRTTITLGTPFEGAVKAACVLAAGTGAPMPLPHRRMRNLAVTMPGVYDLLPRYPCVEEGRAARQLQPGDIQAIGGNEYLAKDALAFQRYLGGIPVGGLRTIVGTEQTTMQSLRLSGGLVEGLDYLYEDDGAGGQTRISEWGDGMVYRGSAAGGTTPSSYVAQTHGALPRSEDVQLAVRAILTERAVTVLLAGPMYSLDVPDLVRVDEYFDIIVRSVDDPTQAICQVVDAATERLVDLPKLGRRDDVAVARVRFRQPGLYRIMIKGSGRSSVSELIMVIPELDATDE
jgi:pimeloyl-ACP methyl ester carboxylesterase